MKFQFIFKRFSIQQDSIAMLTLYGASELDDEYFSFNSDDFAEMENKHRCPAASSIEIFQEQECVNIVHDERVFFSLFQSIAEDRHRFQSKQNISEKQRCAFGKWYLTVC